MRWDTFHVLGISSLDNCSSLYAPPPTSLCIWYWPSQLAENLSSFFLALLTILQTKYPLENNLGCRFALYFLVALCLAARLRIWAFSLNLGRRSRWCSCFDDFELGRTVLDAKMVHLFQLVSWRICRILGRTGIRLLLIEVYICKPITLLLILLAIVL